jgi:hypothetical protein
MDMIPLVAQDFSVMATGRKQAGNSLFMPPVRYLVQVLEEQDHS